MALRSSHCRITAGLASMDRPLLVSSVESRLCGCLFVVLPHQLVGSGGLPLLRPFALLLASCGGIPSGSLPRVPCQVFAMGSPFWVEPVSILDRNIDSTSTFLVLVGVFAMGSPCWVDFVSGLDPRIDSGLAGTALGVTGLILRTAPGCVICVCIHLLVGRSG